MRRTIVRLIRGSLIAILGIALLAFLLVLALESGPGKAYVLRLALSQASRFLTAPLEIGAIRGSLFRDLELDNVRIVRAGQPIVAIDKVEVSYTIAELLRGGTTIRTLRISAPRIDARRDADGRWNIAALLKPSNSTGRRPARAVTIRNLEIVNGSVVLRDPVVLSGIHVPGRYERLHASFAVQTTPGAWRVDIANASWLGGTSDLAVDSLAGTIASDPAGLTFSSLAVRTAQSAFVIDGRVLRGGGRPATFDLRASAERFVFQEWGRVIPALATIPIDARFEAGLAGPLAQLAVDLDLHSNGGDAKGPVVLNTTIPGWHGSGTLDLARLDLAPWFNNPAHKSEISGRAVFDLALHLGRGVPNGTYMFDGSHAAYGGYEGSPLRARGDITATDWRIAQGSATAYGAAVTLAGGTIGLKSPHAYHFVGHAADVDLRAIPQTIPVPHVESRLALDFDTSGEFSNPSVMEASGVFGESEFIGANIGAGSTGAMSLGLGHYEGRAALTGVDVQRWGRELDVAWMQEPRYAGTVSGDFHMGWTSIASDQAPWQLTGGGRLLRASLFGGTLSNADVELDIGPLGLAGSYRGAFSQVDPSRAFEDDRFAARLTGAGNVSFTQPGFFRPGPIDEYIVLGQAALNDSTVADVAIDRSTVDASMSVSPSRGGYLSVTRFQAEGPRFAIDAHGSVPLDEVNTVDEVDLTYDIPRMDVSLISDYLGDGSTRMAGTIATKGQLLGPQTAVRATGDATIASLDVAGMTASTVSAGYDAAFPWITPSNAVVTVKGTAESVVAFGQTLQTVSGFGTYDDGQVHSTITMVRTPDQQATVASDVRLRTADRAVDINAFDISFAGLDWRMLPVTPSPVFSWDAEGIALTPATLVTGVGDEQRLAVSGTWREDGKGAITLAGTALSIDALTTAAGQPATYGGRVDVKATIAGTVDRPVATAQVSVTDGRVRRLTYERLAGRVDYTPDKLALDLRLDQAPGVWLTVAGTVPPGVAMGGSDTASNNAPIDLMVVSSDVSLGLLEGLTASVRNVSGRGRGSVHVTGSRATPLFDGSIDLVDTGFQVVSTGAQYRNGRVTVDLAADRLNVSQFHLEDRNGRALEVTGSLGTRALRVGDVEVDIRARGFEVLRNPTGTVQVDAGLKIRGTFDAPKMFGDITISGGELRVDEIIQRALFQPYSTEALTTPGDVIAALNPWDRLSLDVAVHSQNALRMTGENLAVSQDAPLGLGSFNLRAAGDVFLYKEAGAPLAITGSLDSISGSYAFQGRRFELYPSSSVDFRGDLDPGLFISVNRVISGVETRVTIAGTLSEPELRLSSTPPLDPSDILSLIVFNTSTNDLTSAQQRELAVRAGTLAVGFLTSSLTTALERSIGLDVLEIEPVTGVSGGARVTIGEEIAPGLVARFSRQFGTEQYDEATIEYYISRILRLRGTFSDAGSLARSPFRRVEPAGIDLLLFFSF